MQTAINLICIRDNTILLVLKDGFWILPGGKPYQTETEEACLIRELDEELLAEEVIIGKHYGDFEGLTPHGKERLTAVTYFGDIGGDLTASNEISDAEFFSRDEFADIPISEITLKIIAKLIEDGFLK